MIVDDFKDTSGDWVKSYGTSGVDQVVTYSYQRWNSMQKRCKVGGATQKSRPTYIGCTMSPMFSNFQLFTDWHIEQIGYNIQGYQLDKDILFEGNKEYSESTCALVPRQLNSFLVACDASRGLYPQGVHLNKQCQRYHARINIDGKKTHIGLYSTPEAASSAYKVAKEVEAKRWYERLKAGEFAVDERVIERMRTWTLEK